MEVLPCHHPGPSTPGERQFAKNKFETKISQVGDPLPRCLDGPPCSQPTCCHHHLCRRTHNCPGTFLSSAVHKLKWYEGQFKAPNVSHNIRAKTWTSTATRLGSVASASYSPWYGLPYLSSSPRFFTYTSSFNIIQCIVFFRVLSYPSYSPSACRWLWARRSSLKPLKLNSAGKKAFLSNLCGKPGFLLTTSDPCNKSTKTLPKNKLGHHFPIAFSG